VIQDFACERGNTVSFGHGVYAGQACGTCAWVRCVDGDTYTCKDLGIHVFAHMRVDNPRSAPSPAEISRAEFLKRWPDIDNKMDLKYEVMPNPNCDVWYSGHGTAGDWTLMHGVSYHSDIYGGPQLCSINCEQGDCFRCSAQGQVIQDFACERGNTVSFGHGVYAGQACGTCAWVRCVDGDTYTCKDLGIHVFAHMRVDNPRSAPSPAEISRAEFLKRWPDTDSKMDLKYEVMPNPNCDVWYPGR